VWPIELAAADDPATPTMLRLLQAWTGRADQLGHIVHTGPPVLSRGDANLLNRLWSDADGRIRCVDFEHSGYSTVAFDAADHTEHISARGIPDDRWEEILPDLGITPALRPAYESARRTCALRRLAVLWRRRTTRPADFEAQLARTRALFAATGGRCRIDGA
jgi:Predicted choline kinase involved in LPS biosynthesis